MRWYRAEVPAGELQRRGHHVTVSSRLDKAAVRELDVIVFHRQFTPGALAAMEDANERGKCTVLDIDDDVWNLPTSNPVFQRWRDPANLRGLEACVRAARVVTTPGPVLAESLRRMNADVRVLPNMLRAEDWSAPAQRPATSPLVIGWGGSASHVPDLRMLSGAIEQFVAATPGVEFRSHGLKEAPFEPSDRLRILPGVPLEEYPDLVRTFDVGIAPLADTRFNRSKSDLKVLEYAAAGAFVVASRVDPYERAIRHGETGLLVGGSAKDWLKALRRAAGEPELRASATAAARRWAEGRFIGLDRNIALWERAFGLGS